MKNFLATSLILSSLFLSGSVCQAQLDGATQWVPNGANMIVLVRSRDIFASDVAMAQGWKKKAKHAFDAGASKIPPSVAQYLIASQMDLEYMEPVWQVAVFESRTNVDLVSVSKEIGGNLDMLDGDQSLALPNDAILVRVSDKTIASMTPANRQAATRWLKRSKGSQHEMSSYLSAAVKFADNNAQIIAAIDFEHIISPDAMEKKLKGSKLISAADVAEASILLSEMKGITFGVTFLDSVTGAIKVDFNKKPDLFAANGKQIVIEALKVNGMMIDDVENWKASINGNQLLLRGPLSTEGLRNVSMLIEHPLHAEFGYETDTTVDAKTKTLQYFKSVEELVNTVRKSKTSSLSVYAKWFDRYARQIDDLSVLNVDEDVVEFGQNTADTFRQISGILLQGDYNRMTARTNAGDTGYYNNSYYRGYRSRYNNRTYTRRVDADARMEGGNKAREVMRGLDSTAAKLRKELTQKYKIDF